MPGQRYMDLINCQSPEEVYARVREWSSDLSDQEHLIRSTILDIQADIERTLKQVLYQILLPLVFHGNDEVEHEAHKAKLEGMVTGLPFSTVHRLLKSPLDAYPVDEYDDIQRINEARNYIANRTDISKLSYKSRSLFSDPDCFAQLFFDGWAVRQQLGKFYETMISSPRWHLEHYAKFYQENYHKLKDQGASNDEATNSD